MSEMSIKNLFTLIRNRIKSIAGLKGLVSNEVVTISAGSLAKNGVRSGTFNVTLPDAADSFLVFIFSEGWGSVTSLGISGNTVSWVITNTSADTHTCIARLNILYLKTM